MVKVLVNVFAGTIEAVDEAETMNHVDTPQQKWVDGSLEVDRMWGYDRNTDMLLKPKDHLDKWKIDRLTELATFRYQQEGKGITFNNKQIDTSSASQAKITAAYNLAKMKKDQGVFYTFNWKCKDGSFAVFNVDQVLTLANLVSDHVQQCFKLEKKFSDIINALTDAEAVKKYDFYTPWLSIQK